MAEKFHRAARDGYLDFLREGTKRELNETDEDGMTPAMCAARNGNVDALRMIIMRGGDTNKMDYLGSTALHYSARYGHVNCVSFLINFGCNVWSMDNDHHTALDMALMNGHEDIAKFLDEAQNAQIRKNPKIVQSLKEKAMINADKNQKMYEKKQEQTAKEMEKQRKRQEIYNSNGNSDFKAPSEGSFFKKLTLRLGKKGDTAKLKTLNGTNQTFSDMVTGTSRRGVKGKILQKKHSSDMDFKVSETDDGGKRTLRSLRGVGVAGGSEVLYTNKDGGSLTDNTGGIRPALTNIFPETSIEKSNWQRSKSENDLLEDSGIDDVDSYDPDENRPGLFSRPQFGNLTFMQKFNPTSGFSSNMHESADGVDGVVTNGFTDMNGDGKDVDKRHSSGSDSIGTIGSLTERVKDLPWKEDDVENLDDDEEENEFSPVVLFLESCGLSNYAHLFTRNEVDMEALLMLKNEDFHEMRLPVGPRRKLLDAIEKRKEVMNKPAAMSDTYL